jgi:hypothetical protein
MEQVVEEPHDGYVTTMAGSSVTDRISRRRGDWDG